MNLDGIAACRNKPVAFNCFDRKCVEFFLILLCQNRSGSRSELAKSKNFNYSEKKWNNLTLCSCRPSQQDFHGSSTSNWLWIQNSIIISMRWQSYYVYFWVYSWFFSSLTLAALLIAYGGLYLFPFPKRSPKFWAFILLQNYQLFSFLGLNNQSPLTKLFDNLSFEPDIVIE